MKKQRFTEEQIIEILRLHAAGAKAEDLLFRGLVRFLGSGGAHDTTTDKVIEHIQQEGLASFGGTTWRGQRAMRIAHQHCPLFPPVRQAACERVAGWLSVGGHLPFGVDDIVAVLIHVAVAELGR